MSRNSSKSSFDLLAYVPSLVFLPLAGLIALGVFSLLQVSSAVLTIAAQVAAHGPNGSVAVAAPASAPASAPERSSIEN